MRDEARHDYRTLKDRGWMLRNSQMFLKIGTATAFGIIIAPTVYKFYLAKTLPKYKSPE